MENHSTIYTLLLSSRFLSGFPTCLHCRTRVFLFTVAAWPGALAHLLPKTAERERERDQSKIEKRTEKTRAKHKENKLRTQDIRCVMSLTMNG